MYCRPRSPVFSQHMMKLKQSLRVPFVFFRTRLEDEAGWRYRLVIVACFLSVAGLTPELATNAILARLANYDKYEAIPLQNFNSKII